MEKTQSETNMENTNVTPWKVEGKIDYRKLIDKFGCDPIEGSLIKRFEQVTNTQAHCWLRRGIFFSNKDLNLILDDYEKERMGELSNRTFRNSRY